MLILFGGILFLGGLAVVLYGLGWDSGIVEKVAIELRYPALIVNAEMVPWSEYKERLTALEKFYDVEAGMGMPQEAILSGDDLKAMVLSKLVEEEVVAQLAKDYGVEVTNEDVESQLAKAIENEGSPDLFAERIEQLYGWNLDDFVKYSLRPGLVDVKLQEKYLADKSIDAENRKGEEEVVARGEAVLAEIEAGKNFADLARDVSEDPGTAERGGDLGFFGRGEMVPEFEEAAFILEEGEVSGLVRSAYGYHIIKVEKKEDDRIRARHILLKVDNPYSDWIISNRQAAKVWVLVNGFRWDGGMVVKK